MYVHKFILSVLLCLVALDLWVAAASKATTASPIFRHRCTDTTVPDNSSDAANYFQVRFLSGPQRRVHVLALPRPDSCT